MIQWKYSFFNNLTLEKITHREDHIYQNTEFNMTEIATASENRLAKICETIRQEALLPGQLQAKKIEETARHDAEHILKKAKEEAKAILDAAYKEVARHKQIVESSLEQASRQVIDHLKENIEQKMFQPELLSWVQAQMNTPEATNKLVDVLVDAISREGTATDLAIELPKKLSGNAIIAQLTDKFTKELGKNPIQFGSLSGGVLLKLQKGRVQIEVTDTVITELLSSYLRKDFRRYIFGQNGT